ncbi:flagellar hook assembly protein FlgD [Propylenella binzhouense]|uniref:Basal-body rod modification protein FlgD n=1 Tax=Propylenella binzhouense TaxID=2555902 RepID=A0A964T2B6_9HYPH|nr:flagellar hook assembly protein FlgD [Propylenella binzhouense]MYZ46960.1 flagellar hook assembly protein FlgD [Propylenella binzhouense]
MEVTSSTSAATAASSASSSSASSASSLDYDAFLKLLIAQMQNQDPTNPMDSSEYVAQFASFATVEQGIATNAKLDALLTSSSLAQADGVIGRTATSADGTVSGTVTALRMTSGAPVAVLDTGDELVLDAGVTIS